MVILSLWCRGGKTARFYDNTKSDVDEPFGAECFDLRKNMAVIQTPITAPGEPGLTMGVEIDSGFFFGVHRSFLTLFKTVIGGSLIKGAAFFQCWNRVDVAEGALGIIGKPVV